MSVWLRRFAYRCGYGVHSPFAFNFITGVVFEKGFYYAYQNLDHLYLTRIQRCFSHRKKQLHFLFRLTNFVMPDVLVSCAPLSEAEISYISAARTSVPWSSLSGLSGNGMRVLCFCDFNDRLKDCLKIISENAECDSALLVRVASPEELAALTRLIAESTYPVVTFDLYDYMVVFFNTRLHRQHYLVNFYD